jgi:DNA repair exonuclease SbcCD nuclease subunit
VVVLPDTQTMVQLAPGSFFNQTKWIMDNEEEYNIKFVIHLGDLVQGSGNKTQWDLANKSMSLLDGEIPYLVIPGNHDYDDVNETYYNHTNFNNYFPVSRFNNHGWFGGNYPENSNRNNYGFFKGDEEDFLVLGMEFCPRNDVLNWADNIISNNEDKQTILFTHMYMSPDNTRVSATSYANCTRFPGCQDGKCNSGEEIWNKLASKHENIPLILSGHMHSSKYGTAALKTDCVNGKLIHQTLQNFQNQYGDDGKEAWFRLYQFKPLDKRIDVKTYSANLNQFDYSKSQDNNFSLMYLDSNCIV